jgi:uncharacterized protein (TIGR02246 family)
MTYHDIWLCVIALTSMLMLAGCQTAPTPEPKRDIAADLKAINALRSQFASAYSSGDAAAAAACYADDAIMMPPNQTAVEGRQNIRSMFEAFFKEGKAKIVHAALRTQVAGEWAFECGDFAITTTPNSGKPVEQSMKYLVILKRQPDASWKVYRDISNNNPPTSAAGRKK